jgi:hypothetical protein
VQLDEWGLPITSAELSDVDGATAAGAVAAAASADAAAAADAGRLSQPAHQQPNQQPNQQPLADIANLTGSAQQRQQQQQQQQQQRRRHMSAQQASMASRSSDDEASWHLDLSQYGSYMEQEHAGVKHGRLPERADSGITWQQLQQGNRGIEKK